MSALIAHSGAGPGAASKKFGGEDFYGAPGQVSLGALPMCSVNWFWYGLDHRKRLLQGLQRLPCNLRCGRGD